MRRFAAIIGLLGLLTLAFLGARAALLTVPDHQEMDIACAMHCLFDADGTAADHTTAPLVAVAFALFAIVLALPKRETVSLPFARAVAYHDPRQILTIIKRE